MNDTQALIEQELDEIGRDLIKLDKTLEPILGRTSQMSRILSEFRQLQDKARQRREEAELRERLKGITHMPFQEWKEINEKSIRAECELCGGTGENNCKTCDGSGQCPECNGQPECKECGAECPECDGSGECPDCGDGEECPACNDKGLRKLYDDQCRADERSYLAFTGK